MYSRPQVYIPILQELSGQYEFDLQIIAFVRNHQEFMSSAISSGELNKTAAGPVQDFKGWAESRKGLLHTAVS